MCGIVGLFLKNKALEPKLGSMMAGMLETMCDRAPTAQDLQGGGLKRVTLSLRCGRYRWVTTPPMLQRGSLRPSGRPYRSRCVTVIAFTPEGSEQVARKRIEALGDNVTIVGSGTRMEIYKEVGRPDTVAKRFHLEGMSG